MGIVESLERRDITHHPHFPMTSTTSDKDTSAEELRARAAGSLSSRLSEFRTWLKEDAGASVHPSVCIVNSEATDGTKNAPVLTLGLPTDMLAGKEPDRLGSVEGKGEEALYSRTMGCQVRAVREMKKGDSMMSLPRSAMVTPDLVAYSDAGRVILACCKEKSVPKGTAASESRFWDTFANTRERENEFKPKTNTGPQLLVKILQERKRVETAFASHLSGSVGRHTGEDEYKLVEPGIISTRAPLLAFLIHQRFHGDDRPSVASKSKTTKDQFRTVMTSHSNALKESTILAQPPSSPQTYGPYARTLPASVLIPICWTREELALLSGCIPGRAILEDVLAQTIQLSVEFIALLDAGILERFPETFPYGIITWDRWVWASSIVSSRILPATAYFNKSDSTAFDFKPDDDKEFQSPPEIWDELGVMVPLLDMLNHEIDSHQVRWQPNVTEELATVEELSHPPTGILEKKVRKGAELFCAYGDVSNHNLIVQYGMAQINNTKDEARLGWGLFESVGGSDIPSDFQPVVEGGDQVYECNNQKMIDQWWTEERLRVLEREASLGELVDRLKQGQKLSALAYNDGALHPVLLAASVVATMPKSELSKSDGKIVLNLRHQKSLRNSLASFFSRKLEKLLVNLDGGLKAHFSNLALWTKASQGGLRYKQTAKGDSQDGKRIQGWQTFFEANAYRATMEVEKNYYAMAPDSCALVLYDGHLRALHLSLESMSNEETFKNDVVKQLEGLGYSLSDDSGVEDDACGDSDSKQATNSGAKDDGASAGGGEKKTSPGRRRRSRKKAKDVTGAGGGTIGGANADKPPALKLHVGNLAYSTTPSDLYDFFSTVYGKDNILECHIPVERETGRSRGFGFVTMPESVAMKALTSGKKHEIAGRLLKVARSNSAGTTDTGRAQPSSGGVTKDRCVSCGYRPKYCICSVPNLPPAPQRPHFHNGSGHGPALPEGGGRGADLGADRYRVDSRYRDDRYMEERYGRVRDYERGGYGSFGYESQGRDNDRDYDYDRERRRDRPSSSRSYHSDYDRVDRYRDRRRHRDRDRSRDGSFDSRSPSRRRSENDDSRGRRESRRDSDYERKRSRSPRSRSGSRSPERSRRRKNKKRES